MHSQVQVIISTLILIKYYQHKYTLANHPLNLKECDVSSRTIRSFLISDSLQVRRQRKLKGGILLPLGIDVVDDSFESTPDVHGKVGYRWNGKQNAINNLRH